MHHPVLPCCTHKMHFSISNSRMEKNGGDSLLCVIIQVTGILLHWELCQLHVTQKTLRPKPHLPRWSAPHTFRTGQQANYLFCTAVSADRFRAHELAWVVHRAVQLLALLTVLRARALAYHYGTSRVSALSVCHEDVGALVSWPMLQTKYLLMYFRAASSDAKNLSTFCFYRCYHKSLSLSNEFQ